MWYRHNRKGYICGNYAKHGNIACSHHAIKEQQLIETILTDIKSIYESFERLDTEKQIKNKVHGKRIQSDYKPLKSKSKNKWA
jgi:site-specific DNA recombinase